MEQNYVTVAPRIPAVVAADAPDAYRLYRLHVEHAQVLWIDQRDVLLVQFQVQTLALNTHHPLCTAHLVETKFSSVRFGNSMSARSDSRRPSFTVWERLLLLLFIF